MNLRLYLFVYDVIEKNDGRRLVQDFFAVSTPGDFRERVGVFCVCGVFVDD